MNEGKKPIIQVRHLNEKDQPWLKKLIIDEWNSIIVVTRGRIHQVNRLPGLVALIDEKKIGLLTYRISNEECEIITLNSLIEYIGVGKTLIKEIENLARMKGCNRLWVITTNDNTDAMHFYQKNGFKISAIYFDAIKESRKLKPEIPLQGLYDIEIRDEIELEKKLK